MKIGNIILIVIIIVFSATAQEKHSAFHFNTGFSVPVSPDNFTDYWQVAYNLGGGVSYYFTPSFSIQAYFDYNNFSVNEDEILEDSGLDDYNVTLSGGNISTTYISGNIQYNIIDTNHKVSPYIFTGVGFLHRGVKDLTITDGYDTEELEGNSDDAFAIDFGAGLQINFAPNFSLFGDVRYLIGFTEDENTIYVPFRVGGIIWL